MTLLVSPGEAAKELAGLEEFVWQTCGRNSMGACYFGAEFHCGRRVFGRSAEAVKAIEWLIFWNDRMEDSRGLAGEIRD